MRNAAGFPLSNHQKTLPNLNSSTQGRSSYKISSFYNHSIFCADDPFAQFLIDLKCLLHQDGLRVKEIMWYLECLLHQISENPVRNVAGFPLLNHQKTLPYCNFMYAGWKLLQGFFLQQSPDFLRGWPSAQFLLGRHPCLPSPSPAPILPKIRTALRLSTRIIHSTPQPEEVKTWKHELKSIHTLSPRRMRHCLNTCCAAL